MQELLAGRVRLIRTGSKTVQFPKKQKAAPSVAAPYKKQM
jgi:hypothetical protein